jgi:hypothetical protein
MNKKIICLAVSTKYSEKCIAGKDPDSHEWIRPVSDSGHGELSQSQIEYDNGEAPSLLDIMEIPFEKKKPLFNQPENIAISQGKWRKVEIFPKERLDELCDHPSTIWINNNQNNDRMSVDYLKSNPTASSLLLLKPDFIQIRRTNFIEDSETVNKKVRAFFSYNNTDYDLAITDPHIKREYLDKAEGTYELKLPVYLCISLGMPNPRDNCCYKLVAAIIQG